MELRSGAVKFSEKGAMKWYQNLTFGSLFIGELRLNEEEL